MYVCVCMYVASGIYEDNEERRSEYRTLSGAMLIDSGVGSSYGACGLYMMGVVYICIYILI